MIKNNNLSVIASVAKQSRGNLKDLAFSPGLLRRFTPRNDGKRLINNIYFVFG